MEEQNQNQGNESPKEVTTEEMVTKLKENGYNVLTNDELGGLTKSVKEELNKHFGARFKQIDDLISSTGLEKGQDEKAEDYLARMLATKKEPEKPEPNEEAVKAFEERYNTLLREKEEQQSQYESNLNDIKFNAIASDIMAKLPIDENFASVAEVMKKEYLKQLKSGKITADGLVFTNEDGTVKRNEQQQPITAEDIAQKYFKELLKKEAPKKKGVEIETSGATITDAVSFASSKPPKTLEDALVLAQEFAIQRGEAPHAGGQNVRGYQIEIMKAYKI